ncbi:unnamed protein product, partial [Rotaria sp. Silwood2]
LILHVKLEFRHHIYHIMALGQFVAKQFVAWTIHRDVN